MKPKWQKLASLAQKCVHSSFMSLVQSLLPKDTLLRTYLPNRHLETQKLKILSVAFLYSLSILLLLLLLLVSLIFAAYTD